jgi:hypothetical protein
MSASETFHYETPNPGLRQCPWCTSYETVFHQRGYTGPTDEVNQYFTCMSCHRVTYELIAKSSREMRLGRFRPGGSTATRRIRRATRSAACSRSG